MIRFLKKLKQKARKAVAVMKSKFDREGSYTGTPEDGAKGNAPQQDADDL